MLRLEVRPQPSKAWGLASPLLALVITVVIGVCLFAALGKDPVRGLQVFFWEPIKSPYALSELMVKATPLLIIALGLAVCFRSNVWNIGAEGQYILGAIFAAGVALTADKSTGPWIVPAVLAAGVLGGLLRKSPMSLPALKMVSWPCNSTTRTAASSAAPRRASASSAYMAAVKEFFLSKRLRVRVMTPDSTCCSTSLMVHSLSSTTLSDFLNTGA